MSVMHTYIIVPPQHFAESFCKANNWINGSRNAPACSLSKARRLDFALPSNCREEDFYFIYLFFFTYNANYNFIKSGDNIIDNVIISVS